MLSKNSRTKAQYKIYKEKNEDKGSFKDFLHKSFNEDLFSQLVKNIILTIGFQIKIENRRGTLEQLTNQIAKQYISISSINIGGDDKVNIINLGLGFSPVEKEVFQELTNLNKFMENLQSDLGCIIDIKRLSVDHLN
jgi:ACT domain-containing protein